MVRALFIVIGIVVSLCLSVSSWQQWQHTRQSADTGKFVVLDVGQGDALYLETLTGSDILIDGGPDNTVVTALGQELSFWDRDLELVVLTHPDADHLTGFLYILERYPVQQVLTTHTGKDTQLYQQWLSVLQEKNIPVWYAEDLSNITLSDQEQLQILYPKTQTIFPNNETNDHGIVARYNLDKQFSILFTADTSSTVENYLMAQSTPVVSTILKVGHHGSKYSTSAAWLEAVQPQTAVISVGANNTYGHPHPDVLQRLRALNIPVWRTDQMGKFSLIFKADGSYAFD